MTAHVTWRLWAPVAVTVAVDPDRTCRVGTGIHDVLGVVDGVSSLGGGDGSVIFREDPNGVAFAYQIEMYNDGDGSVVCWFYY